MTITGHLSVDLTDEHGNYKANNFIIKILDTMYVKKDWRVASGSPGRPVLKN